MLYFPLRAPLGAYSCWKGFMGRKKQDKAGTGTYSAESVEGQPYLSVVIPAYNEAARLPSTIDKVMGYLEGRDYPYEVLVVDDGSSDATADLVEQAVEKYVHLHLVRNPHRGKGFAVRTGMLKAKGRYILYSDADLSAPIEEIEKL